MRFHGKQCIGCHASWKAFKTMPKYEINDGVSHGDHKKFFRKRKSF